MSRRGTARTRSSRRKDGDSEPYTTRATGLIRRGLQVCQIGGKGSPDIRLQWKSPSGGTGKTNVQVSGAESVEDRGGRK